MQSRVTQVLDSFSGGYNCCQAMLATYSEIHGRAVLAVYGDIFGISRETALKTANGLSGGSVTLEKSAA